MVYFRSAFSWHSMLDEEEKTPEILKDNIIEENDAEEKKLAIEDALGKEIEDIKFLDISFYDEDGTHLPVKDAANVTLNVENLNLTKTDEEEIFIAHFGDMGLNIYEPDIVQDEDGNVKELSFDTDGFSVFAIIKHNTWKRVQINNELYTLAIDDEPLKFIDIENDNSTINELARDDLKEIESQKESGSPFEFISPKNAQKYTRFIISAEGDEYSIKDVDSQKYLSIEDGKINLSDDKYLFKFYENSKNPGRIKIFGQSLNNMPRILVYDKAINNLKIVTNYEDLDNYVSNFFVVRNRLYYKALTHSEIDSMPDVGRFVIVTDNDQTRYEPKGFTTDYYSSNIKKRDSVQMKKNGSIYTSVEDSLLNNRYKEPSILTFTRVDFTQNHFYIQDENGNYLKFQQKNPGEIYFTPEKTETVLLKYSNNDEIFLQQNNIYYLNLDTITGGWHVWQGTPSNSRVKIAKLLDDTYEGEFKPKKLVDAVIPDGYYVITNIDASKIMFRRYAQDFQGSVNSNDIGGRIYRGVTGALSNGVDIFNIRNNNDGTYYINQFGVNGGDTRGYLRITSLGSNVGYKNLAFYQTPQQKDDHKVKISRYPDDPSLFYIHNQYGSIDIFPNEAYRWRSRQGDFGSPLRLYKVEMDDKGNNKSNKRFIENQTLPTEVFADIADGKYIIGNATEKPTNTKTEFKVLDGSFNVQDALIHYSDDFGENVPLVEAKDLDTKLFEWSIKQTDEPGYYEISKTSENGEVTDTKLILKSDGLGTTNATGKLRIYKVDDTEDLKVIITDGKYRLRYDGEKFTTVTTDEKLTEEDYFYLGKKEDNYLSFKLTTPSEYGPSANWLYNKDAGSDVQDGPVRLQERILIKDLIDDNGEYNFNRATPLGYFKTYGPIGRIYSTQKDGVVDEQYKNLYRLALPDVNFKKNVEPKDHYVEYAFMGYKVDVDGTVYLLNKNAKFEIYQENDEPAGVSIDKEYLTILNQDGTKTPATEKLQVPFGEKYIFETRWLELSSPLYFNFNSEKGISDQERSISADELLKREINETSSPMMGEGRILFQKHGGVVDVDLNKTSSITMDYKVRDKFRNIMNIDFPTNLEDEFTPKQRNQIIFDRVVDPQKSNGSNIEYTEMLGDYNVKNYVTSNVLKDRAVRWLKETDINEAGILKYDIEDKNKEIIFKIPKERFDTDRSSIDFLNVEQKETGTFLRGILYCQSNTISVEKIFKNVTDAEFEKLRTGGGGSDRFEIKILQNDESSARPGSLLYTLAFNRTSDGNTKMTAFPQIGEPAKSYWDIERVDTSVDYTNKKVIWSLIMMPDTDYYVEEKNISSGPDEKSLYVTMEESTYGGEVSDSKKLYIKDPKTYDDRIITKKLNSRTEDVVRITNHYSSNGSVLINTFDSESKNPLRDKKFILYKGSDTTGVEYTSALDGTIVLSDLGVGSYRLVEKEEDRDPIYNPISEITFDIKEENGNFVMTNGKSESKNVEFSTEILGDNKDRVENTINISYILITKTITITKEFEGLSSAQITDIIGNETSTDKPFKIIVKGYDESNVEVGSKILNFKNSQGIAFNTELGWRINTLEKTDKTGEINIFDKDENLNLSYMTIEEDGYEHPQFPVTKRTAKLEGRQLAVDKYPYKLSAEDFNKSKGAAEEDKSIDFRIKNIYTDVFDVFITVRGRDFKNERYVPVEDLGLKLYGSIDEADNDKLNEKDFTGIGTFYELKKPTSSDPSNPKITSEFITNEYGQRQIFNFAMYDGNKYIIDEFKNPMDSVDGEEVVYYALEEPLELDVFTGATPGGGTKLKAQLKKDAPSDYYSVPGKYKINYHEGGGTLFIDIDLERTNYRLPETGGLGRDKIYKVAVAITIMSSALLIKNKKEKRREQ